MINIVKKLVFTSGLIVVAFFIGNGYATKSSDNNLPKVQGVIQEISSLSPQEFSNLLQTNNHILLDIRTADEYAAGHIKNSHQIDYYQSQLFSNYLDTLDKNQSYLIYCRTGSRSKAALKLMHDKGFDNVFELASGYNAWVTAGLATE